MDAAPLVAIARSEDDHLDRQRLANRARTLLPRPVGKGSLISRTQTSDGSGPRQFVQLGTKLRACRIGEHSVSCGIEIDIVTIVGPPRVAIMSFQRDSLCLLELHLLNNSNQF